MLYKESLCHRVLWVEKYFCKYLIHPRAERMKDKVLLSRAPCMLVIMLKILSSIAVNKT